MVHLGKSRAVATTIAAALGLMLASPAFAQPADAPEPPRSAAPAPKPGEAKGLFTEGEKKFAAGDFAGALADFEASNTAKPAPATQRLIALSLDKLERYPDAVAAYEKFIADNPPKMEGEVEEASKRVAEIKAMPGKVLVETTPPGASVVIDDAETPYETVTPVEIELAPGKHTLLIGAEGYENTTQEIEVGYASKQQVTAELVQIPPPPPPVVAEEPPPPAPAAPEPPPEPRSKVPAFVTGAVAIAAAGVGTGFGIAALSKASEFEKNPTTKIADSGENSALIADMMFGIAITFGVTSAVLFLSNDTPQTASAAAPKKKTTAARTSKKATIIPAPYVTPTGGGAGAFVRF